MPTSCGRYMCVCVYLQAVYSGPRAVAFSECVCVNVYQGRVHSQFTGKHSVAVTLCKSRARVATHSYTRTLSYTRVFRISCTYVCVCVCVVRKRGHEGVYCVFYAWFPYIAYRFVSLISHADLYHYAQVLRSFFR